MKYIIAACFVFLLLIFIISTVAGIVKRPIDYDGTTMLILLVSMIGILAHLLSKQK